MKVLSLKDKCRRAGKIKGAKVHDIMRKCHFICNIFTCAYTNRWTDISLNGQLPLIFLE